MRVMEHQIRDSSTYSAIFATLLIVLIVVIIAYNSIQKIYEDNKIMEEEQINKQIVIEGLPEEYIGSPQEHILYENLTNEEAQQIISELLTTGGTNFNKIEEIENEINI